MIFPKREITSFISEEDARRHKRFLKQDCLFILPIHFESMAINRSSRARLVFVGDGSFGPNQKCLTFLNTIGKATGQEIQVFGKGFRHQNRFPNCIFHGYVDDQRLLWTNDIHLCPIKYGAGLKTKIALPLAYGLRVIANLESSIGFARNRNLKVAQSKDEFIELVRRELILNWVHKRSHQNIYQRDDIHKLDKFFRLPT